ncbi:hypothetical protein BGI31_04340 [Snodgrassella communis]|nr:hypothetical protein BGI31_04340 [Snodgrassella communis]
MISGEGITVSVERLNIAVNLAKLGIWLEILIDLKPKLLGFFVGLSHLIIYATLRYAVSKSV